MKRLIKDAIAYVDYRMYCTGIKRCNIKVHTVEDTIQELRNTEKSMVRFGDGEITMMRGRSLQLQTVRPEIMEGLKRLLRYEYEEIIVTIPEIFGDLSVYEKRSRQFWRDHLLFSRKIYTTYCNPHKNYFSTSVSRFYYAMADKENCGHWIREIKEIWRGKDLVVVEGARTHNGVGNDLLDTAGSIERIIGPSSNAYERLEEIFQACCQYPKDRLFLVSLGVAAKFLVEKLYLKGYRALDIGNLDMEYEWYLSRAAGKTAIAKHDIVSEEQNQEAGFHEYLRQITVRLDQ
jgi:glycosyltransferase family protein